MLPIPISIPKPLFRGFFIFSDVPIQSYLYADRELVRILNPDLASMDSSTITFLILKELEERPGGTLICLEFPALNGRLMSRVLSRVGSPIGIQGRQYYLMGGRGPRRRRFYHWFGPARGVMRYHSVGPDGNNHWAPLTQAILFRMVVRWKRELRFLAQKYGSPKIW